MSLPNANLPTNDAAAAYTPEKTAYNSCQLNILQINFEITFSFLFKITI